MRLLAHHGKFVMQQECDLKIDTGEVISSVSSRGKRSCHMRSSHGSIHAAYKYRLYKSRLSSTVRETIIGIYYTDQQARGQRLT